MLGFGAGVAREFGEVALPDAVRHSQLYQEPCRRHAPVHHRTGRLRGGRVSGREQPARRLPRPADCGQRNRASGHRRVSRVARVDPRSPRRRLRPGAASDS